MNNLKLKLDELVKKYETQNFINSDPIRFLHKYTHKQDIEISGLISSSLAYGKREIFLEKLEYIHQILGSNPYDFCREVDFEACERYFSGFKYRFNTGNDIVSLLRKLQQFYSLNTSFDEFLTKKLGDNGVSAKQAVSLLSESLCCGQDSKSYSYLFPHPVSNSACKRLNLFLKWMVRMSPVDLGVWSCLHPKDLIIPLGVNSNVFFINSTILFSDIKPVPKVSTITETGFATPIA